MSATGVLRVTRFGDVNADGVADIVDIISLIHEVVFAAEPSTRGEVTCDGLIDIVDIVTLINWVVFGNNSVAGQVTYN